MATMKGASAPRSLIDLLRASSGLARGDGGHMWYEQHRDQVLAHMRGAPCAYGKDGAGVAARLVSELEREPDLLTEARRVLDAADAERARIDAEREARQESVWRKELDDERTKSE